MITALLASGIFLIGAAYEAGRGGGPACLASAAALVALCLVLASCDAAPVAYPDTDTEIARVQAQLAARETARRAAFQAEMDRMSVAYGLPRIDVSKLAPSQWSDPQQDRLDDLQRQLDDARSDFEMCADGGC